MYIFKMTAGERSRGKDKLWYPRDTQMWNEKDPGEQWEKKTHLEQKFKTEKHLEINWGKVVCAGACWTAGPSSSLGSAPQCILSTERKALKKNWYCGRYRYLQSLSNWVAWLFAYHQYQNTGINIASGTRVSDPDPDWIRIQSGQWIRIWIRIQEGKNDPQ